MTSEEAAYVAGIMEGEGCFDNNRGNPRYLRIRVVMTDLDVVERVHQILGCGFVTYQPPREAHHKAHATLAVYDREDVKRIFDEIRPWMGSRRTAKMDALLSTLPCA